MKDCYLSLGLSYRRGNTVRKRLENSGLIYSEQDITTQNGKETRLYLTDEGKKYLNKTVEARRLGGDWHRKAVQIVADYYRALGYTVRLEYRDIDVYAEKDGEKVAIEVESLAGGKDLVQAAWNVQKALALGVDRVESIVKNEQAAMKLRKALKKSPIIGDIERVTVKFLRDFE